MKILIATTSTGDTENIAASLQYLGGHAIGIFRYDQKWVQEHASRTGMNKHIAAKIPHDLSHERVNCDAEIINEVQLFAPDLILYISAWGSTFSPSFETLRRIRAIAPLVHLLFDGADPPWWGPLREMEKADLFDLTVNIDGNYNWPGGNKWVGLGVINGLTLLTPISPSFYPAPYVRFDERPFPIGYAGNIGGFMRKGVVERLQQENMPFVLKTRDNSPYGDYASFLSHCRIVVNVPFTGSGQRKHVKGRVIESAMANACFLEWSNPSLRDWFTPRLEFEEYENADHCVEMCRFLIPQIKRCEEIANALHERVMREHSPGIFWEQVFDHVSFRSAVRAAE